MNRWMLIRRLRGPAFILLVGITALLDQWHIVSFGRSWPLYLILAGVLSLAERAALAQADAGNPDYVGSYPNQPGGPAYSTGFGDNSGTGNTSIVPASTPPVAPDPGERGQ